MTGGSSTATLSKELIDCLVVPLMWLKVKTINYGGSAYHFVSSAYDKMRHHISRSECVNTTYTLVWWFTIWHDHVIWITTWHITKWTQLYGLHDWSQFLCCNQLARRLWTFGDDPRWIKHSNWLMILWLLCFLVCLGDSFNVVEKIGSKTDHDVYNCDFWFTFCYCKWYILHIFYQYVVSKAIFVWFYYQFFVNSNIPHSWSFVFFSSAN
jgi:hypothetical protein